jgi:hypothetical protein
LEKLKISLSFCPATYLKLGALQRIGKRLAVKCVKNEAIYRNTVVLLIAYSLERADEPGLASSGVWPGTKWIPCKGE